MSEYKDFTSLPPDKESQFIVYEKQSVEASKKAMKIGMIVAGIFGLITVAIVFSFTPPKKGHQMAKDDMGMLKRDEKKKSAEKPAPAPESAGAEESAEGTTGAEGEGNGEDSADGEGSADDPAADDSAADDSADGDPEDGDSGEDDAEE